jgi:drug/metabolite transporter (DMT)-like permease
LQNVALSMSQTTNVSFLLSFCPLITILLAVLFFKDQKISWWHVLGLLVALCGVGFVVFNGQHELKISPLGDVLALLAAVSWAFYTQLIRPLTRRHSSWVITRKVFFYGWLTAAPLFFATSWRSDLSLMGRPDVALSIGYLAVFASIFCYVAWNKIIARLGPVRGASFLYLDPVFATLFSFLFMNEVMTPVLATGLCLILTGVFLAQRAGALLARRRV